jgi:serine/threonine protein phosphatase PrpC
LVHRKAWDFSIPEQQQEFRQKVQRIFLDFDEDYCQRKLSQFKDWLQMALRENGNPFEPRYKKLKPSDDGCTLVVNLIYGGFLINANVGDSRSLLMKQNMNKQQQAAIPCSAPQIKTEQDFRILNNIGAYAARYQNRWFPYFASEDHNTSHIRNATRIHQNGGRFILNGETHRVHDLFDQNVDAMNICNVTSSWPRSFAETRFSVDESKFSRLSRCRIGRPVGWKISELNFPSCTTLNLTGTAGDLFFKYDPPLITACPDVEFIELKLESESYLMVMATDGLWDHMVSQSSQIQNNLISDHASEVLADYDAKNFLFGNFNTASSSLASDMDSSKTLGPSDDLVSSSELDMSILQQSHDEDETQLKLQKLGALAHSLADREMIDNENGLYARGFIRYDDVTVFVVLLEKDTHSDDY